MMSNRCLFNKAIFKSDIKRFLPFTIPLLILDLIIFPIIIYSNFNLPNDPLDFESFVGMSVASDVVSFVFSGMFALLMFSFLYKPSTCNAIHAFPIGRRGLFITSFLAGYILLVVPQVIGFAVSIPGIYMTSKVTGQILLLQFVSIFAESFIFYSTGVLAVMLAGNIFAGAVLYLIINFAVPAVEAIINAAVSNISYGILDAFSSVINSVVSFSPVTELVSFKVVLAYGDYDSAGLEGIKASILNSYYPKLAFYFAIAIVFIALSYLFYKKRKLECAGDMTAFKIEIPIISVIVTFVGGALLSMFVNIFVPYKLIGFVILFIAFSFVVFIVTQMILRKTPKVFSVKNLILWAVTAIVAIVGIYCISVYRTNYIPKPSKLESMTVNCSYDITIKDEETIKEAEKFHKALIESVKKKPISKENFFDRMITSYDDSFDEYGVTISYLLKDGRVVIRYYTFSQSEKELVEMLYELENKQHPDSVFTKLKGIDFTVDSCSIAKIFEEYDEKYVPSYDIDVQKLFNSCEKYVDSLLTSYNSRVGITDEKYSSTAFEYRIEFECSFKTDEAQESLERNGMYYYDPLGNDISSRYGYADYNVQSKSMQKFTVTVYVKVDSEPFEMINDAVSSINASLNP
ncbi:MAG: hypothetical protein J5877_00575 [Clostridia bacterium]|nr:hypothetical protein [Clostridia bacterium]